MEIFMKNRFAAIVFFALALLFTGTVGASPASGMTSPKLRKESVILYTGWKDYEIFIDDLPEDSAVTYKSNKKKIASVDDNGIVHPLSEGIAIIKIVITPESGSKTTLKLKVTVKEPYFKVTDSTDIITSRGSYLFKVKRYGSDDEVTWSLNGSQYASITAVSATDCLIEGKAPGGVTLTVSCLGREESFDILVYEGSGAAFLIKPGKKPYEGYYTDRPDYNRYTKDYYMIRSYLERLATLGGGLLVLSKGTYEITNTLCIPSNTTILLEDQATIVKTDYTGDQYLEATMSLFQTVAYNHTQTKFTGYNGEHDISIIGEGRATIDLDFVKCTAVVAAHCSNLVIRGISFENLNSAHFIELDASKDVVITGNVFTDCAISPTMRKEAINLDTPDEETKGFIQGWTSYDKTPDKNVSITDNVFYNLETAIGTHKYSEGSYHENILISRNTFVNVTSYVIRMMNWKDCEISDNYFSLTEEYTDPVNAVILNGAINPTVTGNRFVNFETAITCAHWKNTGNGSNYAETYNELSRANLKDMRKNEAVDCVNNYFEVYTEYGDTSDDYRETYTFTGI